MNKNQEIKPEERPEFETQIPERTGFWLRYCLIIAGVVVLAMIAAGVIYYFWQQKTSSQPNLPLDNGAVSDNESLEALRADQNLAGKMYFKSEPDKVKVGDEFIITVMIDTGGYNISAVSAVFDFDSGITEAVGIDVARSALAMSAEKNFTADRVRIIRGAVGDTDWQDSDDGFSGVGILGEIKFIAKKAGELKLKFTADESKLIFDDGFGTAMKMELEDFSLMIAD